MNFKEEFEKALYCYGKTAKVFINSQSYKGYCLFKHISKNKDEEFFENTPDEIGQIEIKTYSVWLYCKKKTNKIDFLVYDEKRYSPIYQKFEKETGCFSLIVVERS